MFRLWRPRATLSHAAFGFVELGAFGRRSLPVDLPVNGHALLELAGTERGLLFMMAIIRWQ